jgi:hypothetical protein
MRARIAAPTEIHALSHPRGRGVLADSDQVVITPAGRARCSASTAHGGHGQGLKA